MADINIFVDETGWTGRTLGTEIHVDPSDLSASITNENDGAILTVPNVLEFFKAVKRLDQEFREKYGAPE